MCVGGGGGGGGGGEAAYKLNVMNMIVMCLRQLQFISPINSVSGELYIFHQKLSGNANLA